MLPAFVADQRYRSGQNPANYWYYRTPYELWHPPFNCFYRVIFTEIYNGWLAFLHYCLIKYQNKHVLPITIIGLKVFLFVWLCLFTHTQTHMYTHTHTAWRVLIIERTDGSQYPVCNQYTSQWMCGKVMVREHSTAPGTKTYMFYCSVIHITADPKVLFKYSLSFVLMCIHVLSLVSGVYCLHCSQYCWCSYDWSVHNALMNLWNSTLVWDSWPVFFSACNWLIKVGSYDSLTGVELQELDSLSCTLLPWNTYQ